MPTDATFRFSTILALALSCLAVGYAEFPILPEVAVFSLLAVVTLGVLYFLESRIALLSIPAANRLGLAVTLVYIVWCAYRIKRELALQEFKNMGWQMLIVALCGPLVMVTIVAKVARRDKHAGDYWTMHGIGLAGIGMSAAFAEETASFVIVGLYLLAVVWSLTLLQLGRASGAVPPIPGGKQPAKKAVAVSSDPTGHRTDLRPAIIWAVLVVALAVPLYLVTPRSEAAKIDFGKPRMEVGYAADQMVDLNESGSLQTNAEVAFEFTATNSDGSPKTDMDLSQRWRGKVYRSYTNGEWKPVDEFGHPSVAHARRGEKGGNRPAQRAEPWVEPRLGPGQFNIAFDVPAKLKTSFLADPVVWEPDQPAPVAVITDRGPHGWMPQADGTFYTFYWGSSASPSAPPRRYVQVYRKQDPPDVSPPFRFSRPGDDESGLRPLLLNPVPGVKKYADALLKDLIDSGQLPKDCRDDRNLPKPRHREAVARLFALHLATSPQFTYTTDLKRENRSVDPVEDFLFNTKAGHCERFAAALVLMLRSQGIPAVYVLGFKGCEPTEPGKYIVRQEFAHAWAEALVPKPDEPEDPKQPANRVFHWVSLDPTPGGGPLATQDRPWWDDANYWLQSRFQTYVKDYTPEQRRKALTGLLARLAEPEATVGIALVAVLAFATRLAIRRWRTPRAAALLPAEPTGWFSELLALLGAHGIAPARGDTLLEFATAAGAAIQARGHPEAAGVPLAWVDAYYHDRFGGVAPSDARLAELESKLETLRQALENRGA